MTPHIFLSGRVDSQSVSKYCRELLSGVLLSSVAQKVHRTGGGKKIIDI